MEFSSKDYNITKTNFCIKNERVLIILNGVIRQSNDWVIIEQRLKKAQFSYYKVLNKIIKKAINNSVYSNIAALINSITFILKTNEITKHILFNTFEELLFTFLSLKINTKFYSKEQIEDIFIVQYNDNKLTLFKFGATTVKQNYI
jgi:hypothetical protein